jgi:hypothetical protein
MKKVILFSFLMLSVSFTSLFAMEKGIDGKIGTAYSTDPEKFGLNVAADYYIVPDPYLAVGIDTGLYWVKWERVVGKQDIGPTTADLKADTNAYTIPLMAIAQIRMPHLQEDYNIIPYINIGLGMSFMILDYSQPAYNDGATDHKAFSETDFYRGFTWQVLAGMAYKPGPTSKIHLLVELGYRSMKVKRDAVELNMSGFIGVVGVRYPFSTSSE